MMRIIRSIFFVFILFLYSKSIQAAQISEDFSNKNHYGSGTLIHNTSLGALHPPLQVVDYKVGFTPILLEVGDAQHGSFEESTYQNFSRGGDISGQIIRFDLQRFPILKVSRFHLATGWVLQPVGNSPLIIQSQTDVIIEGSIDCRGQNGGDAIGVTPGSGGEGRCGGSQGGEGGSPLNDGEHGDDVVTNVVTGGRGGNFQGIAQPAVGGGGGGTWNTSSLPGNGTNSSINGGRRGDSTPDPEFLQSFGSAGGGGGSGDATDAGGGGGGGGGIVLISAVRDFILGSSPVSNVGSIRVDGGNSGLPSGGAGLGGGGGGGSVRVFAGRNIEIYNSDGDGASQANAGNGGPVPTPGALGGIGRNWFSSVNYNLSGTGFYTPAEEAPHNPGRVEFDSQPHDWVSTIYEVPTTLLRLRRLSTVPISSDFVVQVAGSNDSFEKDDTGWTNDFTLLNNKRYLRIKLTVTASDPSDPDFLSEVSIDYDGLNKENFDFVTSGCGRVHPNQNKLSWILLILPLILLFFLKKFNPR